MFPSYLRLWTTGELRSRTEAAAEMLKSCRLCPRRCGVDRTRGETGFCRAGLRPVVASCHVHRGEEPPISGTEGSGTIFLSHCNLHCVFCQNFPISQMGVGREISGEDLGKKMLDLQNRGCHNVNWVTPTQFVPQILEGLCFAVERGFRLPLVYNTNGYDSLETLALLDGVVDIYLPDMKYGDEKTAWTYSQAPAYPPRNQAAVLAMYRQVGKGIYDEKGMMKRGLIIRHLLLPNRLAGTEKVARFLAESLGGQCSLSLMTQFFPAYRAKNYPPLKRRLYSREFQEALKILDRYQLRSGWMQDPGKN